MLKSIVLGLSVILVVGFVSSGEAAQPCVRHYVFGLMNTPPVYFFNSGKKTGIGYDISAEVMRRLNCRYTERVSGVSTLISSLSKNQLDFLGPATKNVNAPNAEFVELWSSPKMILVNKNRVVPGFETVESYIKDSKVIFGSLIGSSIYYAPEELQFLRNEKRVRTYADVDDVIRALEQGKVHAIIAGPYIFAHYFSQSTLQSKYKIIEGAGGSMSWGFLLSKSRLNVRELQSLKAAFLDMKKDGVLDGILEKYQRYKDEGSGPVSSLRSKVL